MHMKLPRITPDTGAFFARKKFFEKIRFVGLHKYSVDFSAHEIKNPVPDAKIMPFICAMCCFR